jgi:regulator of protease activity HflC (stomatin/prohibitin superfamily)
MRVYTDGTHLKWPWIEKVIDYNVRSLPRSIASPTGSKGNLRPIKST